jgi:MraZ protein
MGSFAHGVDAKGRIFIPSKWREDLGTSVIVTHGILGGSDARCLFGMSEQGWREFAAVFHLCL